eukprot:scaffold15874_cov13-Prasinocladus_malaysianus.AAC.1
MIQIRGTRSPGVARLVLRPPRMTFSLLVHSSRAEYPNCCWLCTGTPSFEPSGTPRCSGQRLAMLCPRAAVLAW